MTAATKITADDISFAVPNVDIGFWFAITVYRGGYWGLLFDRESAIECCKKRGWSTRGLLFSHQDYLDLIKRREPSIEDYEALWQTSA